MSFVVTVFNITNIAMFVKRKWIKGALHPLYLSYLRLGYTYQNDHGIRQNIQLHLEQLAVGIV